MDLPHGHPQGDDALEQLVARVPLFSALVPDELTAVAQRVRPRKHPRQEQLYGAGEKNSKLMIIHAGRVKIYRITESGHEQVIRILGPGDFLGESTFISGATSDHFALTLEASDICELHHDELHDYLLAYPSVAVKMVETLSARLAGTEHQLSMLAGEDAEHRLAAYLMALHDASGKALVKLPTTKKDVASFLGLTPETLSRKLTQFEEIGWLRLGSRRQIELLDVEALRLI
ncbi:Crp/Fnr family transcriptional regulator [Arthrobacter sp. MYb227]|uniref:Crp/Fnr family transcriptional regulator n=1 Tax=Arthrobacter sp. MYb227 TaxID=1848601 RepID=UPI0015E426FF|nr:Crp/Fnr family transcriptional regulator [Arthrobacter sp. MYb227]